MREQMSILITQSSSPLKPTNLSPLRRCSPLLLPPSFHLTLPEEEEVRGEVGVKVERGGEEETVS